MKSEIVLIGPSGSGKSAIAQALAMRTFAPHLSLDRLRWKYFEEIGYDRSLAEEKQVKEGFWGLYRYWKPFEAYAVKRILEDYEECIFDFGSSHSVYEDDHLFQQTREALRPYPFVILLLPSPNIEESIRILHERNIYASEDQKQVNEHFVRHHSNYDLARHIVYTKGREPDETCEEIVEWVKSKSQGEENKTFQFLIKRAQYS